MRSSRRDHPAVRRGGPGVVTRYRAQHGRGLVNVDDSEEEEQRAAGGPGTRRSRHHRVDAERSLIGWRRISDHHSMRAECSLIG